VPTIADRLCLPRMAVLVVMQSTLYAEARYR